MTLKTSGLWPLEKYARFMPAEDTSAIPCKKDTAKKGGTWMHYSSSKDGGLQLAILESNHLLISSDSNKIYESFSLWNAHKWIKGVSKGDSILFIYQLKDENRRFRIKFSALPPNQTPLEACNDCINKLSSLLPIQDIGTSSSSSVPLSSQSVITAGPTDSQVPMEDSQMFSQVQEQVQLPKENVSLNMEHLYVTKQPEKQHSVVRTAQGNSLRPQTATQSIAMQVGVSSKVGELPTESELMPLPALAQAISADGKALGTAYAETNFPVSQLGEFIRLCLTDSNFPGFVEAVEKEMIKITK